MSDWPAVAAVMLNWNGWRDTLECFESLAHVRYPLLDLYLCDNASTDESVERILRWARDARWETVCVPHSRDGSEREAFAGRVMPPRLTVIRNMGNDGFARGTNIAMRYALASPRSYAYLWALNTDTLVESEAVTSAVAVLEAVPHAGSGQSLLLGYPNDKVLDSAGVRLLARGGARDLLRGRPPAEVPAPARTTAGSVAIFGCCAASAFYRTTALQRVGLFDEMLYQTNEDVDLACRLRAAGYAACLVPRSVVRHKGGVSRRRKRGRMWSIAHRAKVLVLARWWPRPLAVPAAVVGAVRALLAALRWRDVRLRDWPEFVRQISVELRGGAPGPVRRRILALGRRGFVA